MLLAALAACESPAYSAYTALPQVLRLSSPPPTAEALAGALTSAYPILSPLSFAAALGASAALAHPALSAEEILLAVKTAFPELIDEVLEKLAHAVAEAGFAELISQVGGYTTGNWYRDAQNMRQYLEPTPSLYALAAAFDTFNSRGMSALAYTLKTVTPSRASAGWSPPIPPPPPSRQDSRTSG